MQTLLSQELSTTLRHRIKQEVAALVDNGIDPHLAVVLVGEDPASVKYVSIKNKVAKDLGIIVSLYHLEEDSAVEQIAETLRYLSADPEIDGVILQLPLPGHIRQDQVDALLHDISAPKDVDGLRGEWKDERYSGYKLENLLESHRWSLPPMVGSVLSLLDHYKIDLQDKKVVLVGRGRLVGQPLEEFLQAQGIDVRAVDEDTDDILKITGSADILIAAAGEPNLVTYQWVKEGAIVIDCNADVHLDSVEQVASAIAPPTGGVGPLTVTWLLYNTTQAAARRSPHV